MLLNKKRGVGISVNLLIVMAIGIMVLVIVSIIVYTNATSTTKTLKRVTPATLQGQITTCKISSIGIKEAKPDGDKLADFCDPCEGGNDLIADTDGDFVSVNCDVDDNLKTSPIMACCGNEPDGDDAEIIAKCDTKRLLSIDPFRCKAATPTAT